MSAFRITRDIPVPTRGGGNPKGALRLALETMEVGDSIEHDCPDEPTRKRVTSTARNTAVATGRKFTTRRMEEQGKAVIRIWRTA